MGTTGSNELIKEANRKQFFSAYKSIKYILQEHIYVENNEPIGVYLIKAKTINDFISTLGDVFNIENENELNKKEKELKKTFEDYSIKDRNVEFYSNYEQCQKIMNNKDKNEFIIVNKDFISKLEIRNADYKKVEINKIEDKCLYIKFLSSGKIINAQEIENKKGFFKFFQKKEEKKEIIKTNINENIINVNSIKKNIDIDSMIKNIFYCLIKINSINNCFLCCGDMIKQKNNFLSKFFNLIDTYNINGEIVYSELSNSIEEKNKKDLEFIIKFIYNQVHLEIKNLFKNEIIINLFNYQYISFFRCSNSNCNSIMKYSNDNNIIKCSLKKVSLFKNSTCLNVNGCFDYLFNNEYINKNNICTKCHNNFIYSQKINYVNDILTIIFDIENDIGNISLDLNFNLKLDKYFLENSQKKYDFELIVFSSYSYEEGKFISFNKDNDKIWHCYNGSKENQIQINNINYKNPVLLIYKKII